MFVSLIHLFILYYPPSVLLCPQGLNLLLCLAYISFHVKQYSALFPHFFFFLTEKKHTQRQIHMTKVHTTFGDKAGIQSK